jgi:hypothetical protein
LQPLSALFAGPVLYFQQLAASFPKMPGWGVPLRNLRDLCVSLRRLHRASRGSLEGRVILRLRFGSFLLAIPVPSSNYL